ncbi:hypothetical protein FOA43_004802 [Brettanomyces nanus]|uniref:Superoxide dismutase 1 copper chaperone n=1 Tax=Eeniella nana TaxID=13502 RepID=A0A875SDB7_EENNA|nr:uncharacterized protein FOA43_004802 [Brettanomyces nanus]QPG77389.1 hypothetical protein FOA43_004802 [Brettanomyces nanus]
MPSTEIEPFETVYNVPLSCDSCVESVTKAVEGLGNIRSVKCDIPNKRVTVIGSSAPSQIVEAIQSTGRDAIIRGTGKPNSAAVSILESFDPHDKPAPVKGLARFVSINPTDVLIDLTMSGVEKGTYYPSIRSSGNLSEGALSCGELIKQLPSITADEAEKTDCGSCSCKEGTCEKNSITYKSHEFVKVPLNISDLIGRSLVISKEPKKVFIDSLCGVIARSAGAWENDKYVCSCTGKTVWQERVDATKRGIN